jgi:hypothetical protein
MRQNTPEDTTARTASPRFSTDEFDCELPPEVRTELVAPKRPRILGRPVKVPPGRRVIVLAVLVLVLAVGVVVAFWSWQRQSETSAAAPVLPAQPASLQPPASVQPPAAVEHVV